MEKIEAFARQGATPLFTVALSPNNQMVALVIMLEGGFVLRSM